jgi:hypothetical protein
MEADLKKDIKYAYTRRLSRNKENVQEGYVSQKSNQDADHLKIKSAVEI